jgi:hypothetical protein
VGEFGKTSGSRESGKGLGKRRDDHHFAQPEAGAGKPRDASFIE